MPCLRTRLLAPLALVVLGGVLAGCESPPPNPWPQDVVDGFLRGCRGQTAEAQCRCAVDRLQRRFTADEFHAFEAELVKGTVPKPMADAVADCAGR